MVWLYILIGIIIGLCLAGIFSSSTFIGYVTVDKNNKTLKFNMSEDIIDGLNTKYAKMRVIEMSTDNE